MELWWMNEIMQFKGTKDEDRVCTTTKFIPRVGSVVGIGAGSVTFSIRS